MIDAAFFADSARWDITRQKLLRLGPLDEEDVFNDLRYLENETRVWLKTNGAHGARFLGREALAKRWGWFLPNGKPDDWRVRKVLDADDWHDPNRKQAVKLADLLATILRRRNGKTPEETAPLSGSSPGGHRVNSGSVEGGERTNADSSDDSSGSSPGGHRVNSGSPPTREHLVGTTSGTTPKPATGGGVAAPTRQAPPASQPQALTADGRPIPEDFHELLAEVFMTRTAQALVRAGITPRQLLAMSPAELQRTPGVAGAWRVIADAVAAKGYPLGCYRPEASPSSTAGPPADDEAAWADFHRVAVAVTRDTPKPTPDAWPDPERGRRYLAAMEHVGWPRWRGRAVRDEPFIRREFLSALRSTPAPVPA